MTMDSLPFSYVPMGMGFLDEELRQLQPPRRFPRLQTTSQLESNTWTNRQREPLSSSIATTKTAKGICEEVARIKPHEQVQKLLQDRRTEVPLEPKHNCVKTEKDVHENKRIVCDVYASAVLIHSVPKETSQAPWHQLAAQCQPGDKTPVRWVGNTIEHTLGKTQVNEPMIDGTYPYGVGMDLDWENLWGYRNVQAQAAMAFLQDHYFEMNEKVECCTYP